MPKLGVHSDHKLLNQVMTYGRLQRDTNEWWHFSRGDQLWTWISNKKLAIYTYIFGYFFLDNNETLPKQKT
ncbi:D-ala-D-ala dipeptidase [Pseudanabaena sp. lw0831]|uniref:M15 family metallopeptidase n=1 Tax=Pseudanabaena sp. lw0831 TaxID=1357935 RepID=UPI001A283072|nr:M15 family metallopeptidase [Pseudanabaena sp. lw0831]GBO51669.1 D-ala-D-ala dipeptidase [Pseudanabaena sp. lw0831]